MASILVAEDEPIYNELLCFYLKESGFTVHAVSHLGEIMPMLSRRSFDVLLLDLFLGKDSSLDIVPTLIRDYPNAIIIIMSAQGTISLAVAAMEKGATTFLTKSSDPKEIVSQVKKRLFDAQSSLKSPEKSTRIEKFKKKLVRKSAASKKLWKLTEKLAAVDSNVLLQGESGSGKEVLARAIHELSTRHAAPFIAMNCAAVPEQLLESELFGYKKGAFTDAKADHKGIFEQAQGGTLLLDEIGDMPLTLQAKLLRVLQNREIKPLGSTQVKPVDFRLIAASHHNLREDIDKKLFREDLFFRIAVIELDVPPLRDRRDDIPQLVHDFVQELSEKYGKKIAPLREDVLNNLCAYSWPGNIRELRNAVERALVLTDNGELHEEDLLQEQVYNSVAHGEDQKAINFTEARKAFEREYLQQLMHQTGGNITKMAKVSGRYRTDIYRLLSKHGLSQNKEINEES